MFATLDLAARGGVTGLALLAALLMLRTPGLTARLIAAFAVGIAAHAWCSAPGFEARFGPFQALALAITSGNSLLAWLLARSLFRDGYRPHPVYGLAWLGLAGAGVAAGALAAPAPEVSSLMRLALSVAAIGLVLLALTEALATWRDDLVDARRRLRVLIVVAIAGVTTLNAGVVIALGPPQTPGLVSLVMAFSTLAAMLMVLWELLGLRAVDLFAAAVAPRAPRPIEADPVMVQRLERLMTEEYAYREDLTVARLAARLGLAEHQLRRLINAGLGHRNFAAFVNGYRVGEARAALADPSQDQVSILTIALDTGFASVGPFNRAFKAETGLTPRQYRRRL